MAAKTKSKGLGKGLEALFGDAEVAPVEKKPAAKKKQADNRKSEKAEESPVEEGGVLYVDLNDIKPNASQPRKVFDEEKLEELAASIQQHGLIQPIVLRKLGKGPKRKTCSWRSLRTCRGRTSIPSKKQKD